MVFSYERYYTFACETVVAFWHKHPFHGEVVYELLHKILFIVLALIMNSIFAISYIGFISLPPYTYYLCIKKAG